MTNKRKYYVVWKGRKPGIYHSWAECKQMISGYKNAQYKGFKSFEEAKRAFNRPFSFYTPKKKSTGSISPGQAFMDDINYYSIAVDAASSGNPGRMEYRGVDTKTRKELFHIGPFPQGTNNIGEFLAIVHGLAFLDHHKSDRILYSDSRIAINWVRRKKCNTTLKPTQKNRKLFELIARAENWLNQANYSTPVVKWETKAWGEIPADFGRK